MWHELVHVKVTAAQALWEKAQSKSRLVSKYQLFICLAVAVRLVWGAHEVLFYEMCVSIFMVYVNIK